MSLDDLLVLSGPQIKDLLKNRELDVLAAVKSAYIAHFKGESFLPHSVFVRFPGLAKERIIALPAYLGGNSPTAGIKWISSFPGNLEQGVSRASAVMVLNSLTTGRAQALLEGSLISAARTAASAALAADTLHAKGAINVLGVIGCGLINREIVRYISSLGREIGRILVYDIQPSRAKEFCAALNLTVPKVPAKVVGSVNDVLTLASVSSFATTAVEPTVTDLSICPSGATLLHISLRDITADAIVKVDNLVDDVDHAVRAQTSLHLAEQKYGRRDFVRATLAEVLLGQQPPRARTNGTVVFSPFGLGVLDLAVAQLVMYAAAGSGSGSVVPGFFAGT